MAFLGGAECSTGANPLAQFSKIAQDDTSLQRDRLVGRGPGGLQEGMRNQAMNGPQDQMMDEFMQQPSQLPQTAGPASPFAMEQMRRELERAAQQRGGSPGFGADFDPGIQAPGHIEAMKAQQGNGNFSAAEFARYQQRSGVPRTASPTVHSPTNMTGYQRPMAYGMGNMGMGYGMMGMPHSQMSFQHQQPQAEGKGKGRMVELDDQDWEAQFKELETADQQLADTDALDREAEAAMERELNDLDRQLVDDDNLMDGMHMGDLEQWEGFDSLGTHGLGRDPNLGEYMFEEDNIFKDVANPYDEGVRIMEEGGNLSLAALAFEAAVQKDPQHVDAWTKLGAAQAQNEKETPAIRALEQSLKLEPSNLEALMGLAVSYTNEGYDSTAYRTLERWVATKYPSLIDGPLSDAAEIGFTDRQALQEKVTDLFIRAAQLSPSGEQMDPDVQVGLGVLFYGAEEYDKAVDCFGAALASTEEGVANQRGQVHLLWNRLGATLANSGRSEEAIEAYNHALEMRPNFVRARYNLGVSCINIGCFEEAAQHLLGALAMHKVVEREGREKAKELVEGGSGGPVDDQEIDRLIHQNHSTNLFDTLRRVFSQMNRRDLSEKVGPGMDVDQFRREFDF